ncbi:armadillo repeat-containing protein 7 [Anoplophora glabripennis]|uniref:armadillo repeat-containing protein 7 n=1 Tax=Anoplophora glabripennis TaxID=217634 RepID=UPI00087436B4|nr:armadillo repeat-containing protein 7 [Anoplophora glabripennis]
MFSRKEQLIKKTGKDGVGRYEFLKQLIHEFTTTTSLEAKRQTLANLANFAYDPINYDYMKQLHLVDLFLAQLSEDDEELIHFALSGLCNISCDPECKEYIISLNGINFISKFLLHRKEEVSLNALTTLFYLFESHAIVPKEIEQKVIQYEASSNPRLKNLGKVFLQTYIPSELVEK